MMTLLQANSLTGITQFQPESMALNLAERQSTATIIVGPEAPDLSIGDWVQDNTEPGEGIVWRVRSVDSQPERETRTVTLEHMIASLQDRIMFGEVKPQDISGGTTCTAQEAAEYILNRQSDWVLGSFGYSVSNPYNFNGENLFNALETVSQSLQDSWWSYDFSTYPFTLNIQPKSTTVGTELREMRTIQSARIVIDKSRMYTRVYPIGKNNIHIDGNYISENEEIYGRIDHTATDQSKGTKAELERWARELLGRHCEPSVTVTVQALDICRETGESLDRIVLGAVCRMPLAEYRTTIEETITKISYPDKIAEPDRATVTLANIQEDVTSIINNLIKSGGGGGRAAAKNDEEKHAWIIEENDHIALLAEGVAGEGAAQDWSRVAELLVDGNGIHQRVIQAQEDIINAYSVIDQTTTAIRIEIGTVASEVRSFIMQTPEMIHTEVGYAVSGMATSVIEQTATYIRTEIENAASSITSTVVEQTVEYIQTTVEATASEVAWSVITQTMTNIEQQIARKSKVYIQWTDPNDGTNVLYEGDVWIKRNNNRTWNEANAAHEKWNQSGVSWRNKYGDLQYVWKNNAWVLIKDFAADVENEVKLEQTATSLAMVGRAVDTQDQKFNSRLEVTARQIRTEVNTAGSQIYSVIEQTSTNIRSQVANEVAGLQSSIEQTAGQIRTEVSNTVSNIRSSITQNADKIALVVSGNNIKAAEIVAAINASGSTIKLSADHIELNGDTIAQKLDGTDIQCDSIEASEGGIAKFICDNTFRFEGSTFKFRDYDVSWKSMQFIRVTNVSPSHRFLYAGSSGLTPSNALLSNVVTSYQNTTIHYLGR